MVLQPTSERVQSVFREEARRRFLEALRTHYAGSAVRETLGKERAEWLDEARGVVDDLAEQPLRAFRGAVTRELAHSVPLPAIPVPLSELVSWDLVGYSTTDLMPDLAALRQSLERWAATWNLNAVWCLNAALRALDLWHRSPESLKRRAWHPSSRAVYEHRFEFSTSGWHADSEEGLAQAKQRIRKEFETAFESYYRGASAAAERAGLPRALSRHEDNSYVWLVRSQVLGVPIDRIAIEADRAQKTVSEAIAGLAGFLGLPLRKRKRGRPKGSRNRH